MNYYKLRNHSAAIIFLMILSVFSASPGQEFSDVDGIISRAGKLFTGRYSDRYANGKIRVQGDVKNGRRTGRWLWYDEAGRLQSMGQYRDGKRHGRWSWYFPDGTMEKLQIYTMGEKEGAWYDFYSDGGMRSLINYDPHGSYRTHSAWYENGSRQYQQSYKKYGEKYLLESVSLEWYRNGVMRFEGYFSMGRAMGPQRWYYDNGSVMLTGFAYGELLLGEWTRYRRDGSVESRKVNPDNDWVYGWIPLE